LLEKLSHLSVKQYTALRGDFDIIFFSIKPKSCNSIKRLHRILGLICGRLFSISVYDTHHSLIDLSINNTHFFDMNDIKVIIGHIHFQSHCSPIVIFL
jgi:hypothetical protein